MATKRKAADMSAQPDVDDDPVSPDDEFFFQGLGGCQEVGRSCHIIRYKGKTIMLDAGMHTGREGQAAMPYLDAYPIREVDILLISHFHLDHAAALPFVLAKTEFQGRVFMTHPTKAIYKWLIQDSVRVSNTSSTSDSRTSMYTEADHIATLPKIETIDFYTTHTVAGVQITPYPAGHVLGAAMFLINIAGLNIFFTGDYSREQDRHLVAAQVPDASKTGKIDVLITESTFGISNAPPRSEREAGLLKAVTNVINRGGKVLMPVFALGRAQELLLILEDYWQRHPDLQKIPIYYTGNTARKCMVVYQTYINAMNDNIKRIFRERMAEVEASGNAKGVSAGPWDFRFVRSLRNLDRFDDIGGCVMLASPGMLQSGMSRILLERWAPDQRNGVVMTGYNVEGTMARTILTEPDQIPAIMSGSNTGAGQAMGRKSRDDDSVTMIPRRCSVEEFQFAAHVTGVENVDFIEHVRAPHVILVHGERSQAARLKSRLLDLNSKRADPHGEPTKVYSPANGDELFIPFRKDKVAKVVGKLAQLPPPKGTDADDTRVVNGVLVQSGFKLSLMAPEDLREYAGLTTTTILCRQHITLAAASIDLIKWALEGTFGKIDEIGDVKTDPDSTMTEDGVKDEENGIKEEADEEIVHEQPRAFLIMGCITLKWSGREKQVELEWDGNTANDGIADAVMAVLMTVESSPASVKHSSKTHSHSHDQSHGLVNGNGNSDDHSQHHNLHANLTPEERFNRLCMFLEAQFGDNVTPIADSRIRAPSLKMEKSDDDEPLAEEAFAAAERARLAALGIPVPGLEIKVDKFVARLWLENLEVECAQKTLKDRVQAVVERAVETVAPLWSVAVPKA